MTNLVKFRIFAAILAVAMMGCSDKDKDNDDDDNGNNPNSDVRLVSYLFTSDSEVGECTYNYEYDSQNRLVKITATGINAGVWNVTYPTASTIRYQNGEKYHLLTKNSQGLVTNYEANVSGIKLTQAAEYENGYLVKTTIEGMVPMTNTYIWSNGKLDVIEQKMVVLSFSTLIKKTTFSYTTTPHKECYISPWLTSHQGNWYTPAFLCGKMSPNLLASETQQITGSSATTINYRYDRDTDGYVTKVYSKTDLEAEILAYEVRYK